MDGQVDKKLYLNAVNWIKNYKHCTVGLLKRRELAIRHT